VIQFLSSPAGAGVQLCRFTGWAATFTQLGPVLRRGSGKGSREEWSRAHHDPNSAGLSGVSFATTAAAFARTAGGAAISPRRISGPSGPHAPA